MDDISDIPPASCHSGQPSSSRRAGRPAVRALQQALGEPAEVTGTYDDRTLAAVLAMQATHLLPANGIVDNDDWRAVGAYMLYGAHDFLLPQVVAPVN